jgi:hypothetical protein
VHRRREIIHAVVMGIVDASDPDPIDAADDWLSRDNLEQVVSDNQSYSPTSYGCITLDRVGVRQARSRNAVA